ncbi:hypothetical protein BVX98_06975 [bacterium F11]|nr:hypothetical protein BVX98_06975 [bacterium F11]
MDHEKKWVIELDNITPADGPLVGGKAARLALMSQSQYPVPRGFCLTANAYQYFIEHTGLGRIIRLELERKSMDEMRWEEIWDTALRIRTAFNSTAMPKLILDQLRRAIINYPTPSVFVVRSSAPGEDSTQFSFAGLHESYIGISGLKKIAESVRLVWASLWSDAALLYRKEMGLNAAKSKMAVVVQAQFNGRVSGVAFGRDPRDVSKKQAVVEAVPGLCRDLVDGKVDPDRWILRRPSGKILDWRAGDRSGSRRPLLSSIQLHKLYRLLTDVEKKCGWEPDMEWTYKKDEFVFLQARPITHSALKKNDERSWYLSLRPKDEEIKRLREKITQQLIPQMRETGQQMAEENLEILSDFELAQNILHRQKVLDQWKKIYWADFIPFAHGVRRLAMIYNDSVKPKDPYEFVGLFPAGTTLASKRNAKLVQLSDVASVHPNIMRALRLCNRKGAGNTRLGWDKFTKLMGKTRTDVIFKDKLHQLLKNDFDITYGSETIKGKPEILLDLIYKMAKDQNKKDKNVKSALRLDRQRYLERKYFKALGRSRRREAQEILETARISWTLRDDDNVLLGRVESQCIRALSAGVGRLKVRNRWNGDRKAKLGYAKEIEKALRNRNYKCKFSKDRTSQRLIALNVAEKEKPRQLIGQPVSPGLATGQVRKVKNTDDMMLFKKGEILVCDSIQPSMTHLVPLASAVIERRGGMLMHGAIIARELGRPCVNGIVGLMDKLQNGELVTVDGQLGIVTVGSPEFDLELNIKTHPRSKELKK